MPRKHRRSGRRGGSGDPHQFHDPARNVPVLHVEIAVGVPERAVSSAEDALFPLLLRHLEAAAGLGVRVMPQHRHDGVALVENHQPAVEVRHRDIVTLNGHRSRHAQPGDHLVDVVALKVIVQQPALGLMVAITDQQSGWIVAGVEGHAVGGVELLEAIPLRAKVRQILSLRAEAKDSVTGIAVREVDLAIGGYGDGGWRPLFDFDTAFFLGRDAQLEDDRPGLSLNLDALASGISGSVEKVTAVLSADLHVVQAGVVAAEMTPYEGAVGREDEDAQIRTGVDVTLAVDDDTAVGRADL